MSKIYRLVLMMALGVLPHLGMAQEPNAPLTFKAWREQQVVDAQNQLARLSNKIVLVKSGRMKAEEAMADATQGGESDSAELQGLTARAQRAAAKDSLERLDRELQRARKAVEMTKDLGVQDYFIGYLSQFQNNSEALSQAASKLSKEEVTELLRSLLRLNGQPQNKPSGLEASVRAQSL